MVKKKINTNKTQTNKQFLVPRVAQPDLGENDFFTWDQVGQDSRFPLYQN